MAFSDWASDEGAWAGADQVADETSGGDYLKIEDGDSEVVVFLGPPEPFKQVWIGDDSGHSELYDENDPRHDGLYVSGRFLFAVAHRVKDGYKAKLFEVSATLYEDIKGNVTKHGAACAYEIKRKGTKTKTKYTVMFDHKLEDKERAYIDKLDQPDPVAAVKAKADGGGSETPDDLPDADVPW